MNAVSLGPLVMDGSRFAVVLAMVVFLIITGVLSSKVDARFNRWSWIVLIFALVGARLGHVALNWESFSQEPLRIFSLWQGGFYWPGAVVAIVVAIIFALPSMYLRLWSVLPVIVALFVWNAVSILTSAIQTVAVAPQSFLTLQNQEFSFDKNQGKPIVINLWASWCPPCRREMPMMAELAAKNEQVEFVFANQGEGRAAIEKYLQQHNIALPNVLLDQFSDLSRHYNAPGLPATLFIGADGMLKSAHLGEISRETLQSNIERLNQ
jgi:thiol-disulfide isomerase/thioredoxin